MTNEMLSVIVPIYNGAKYLPRCLDSLLNQDVEKYEIVCVNDGSTDNSGVILQEYQKKNPQVIKIVEQKNQGLPSARNAGMAVAKGTVLAFCDSDDYLIPHAYGYLLREFWKEEVDLLKFKSMTLDNYVQKEWRETNEIEGKVLFEGSGEKFVIEREPNFCFVWLYLYRYSFLKEHDIKFSPVKQCEDVAFNLDVYMCNPYVVQVSSNIYRYTISDEQLTRIREPHYLRGVVESYMCLFGNMNKYIQIMPEMKETLSRYKHRETIPCMSRVFSANYTRKEFFSIKRSFQQLGVLPMLLPGKIPRIINIVMKNYVMYFMTSFLYRYLFVPYLLPHLRRN